MCRWHHSCLLLLVISYYWHLEKTIRRGLLLLCKWDFLQPQVFLSDRFEGVCELTWHNGAGRCRRRRVCRVRVRPWPSWRSSSPTAPGDRRPWRIRTRGTTRTGSRTSPWCRMRGAGGGRDRGRRQLKTSHTYSCTTSWLLSLLALSLVEEERHSNRCRNICSLLQEGSVSNVLLSTYKDMRQVKSNNKITFFV